jgi:hypothetical protein
MVSHNISCEIEFCYHQMSHNPWMFVLNKSVPTELVQIAHLLSAINPALLRLITYRTIFIEFVL